MSVEKEEEAMDDDEQAEWEAYERQLAKEEAAVDSEDGLDEDELLVKRSAGAWDSAAELYCQHLSTLSPTPL